ncbi:hypothetical protein PRZ48_009296 [Zasmidium cellare]|uniref:Uncharacterized protein n=1 Tax=Zasmidium cellare TaxID=395010 RepID=A0ABR0EC00_ZASCE|nr:hypothetical protein PRZ48_009296 [Zasmidium cellare]
MDGVESALKKLEGQIGSVTLKEVSADSIDAMVSYLYDPEHFEPWYRGPYDDFTSIKHHTDMVIGMWKLADMYSISKMKELAETVFSELFAYDNCVEYMELVLHALSELDGPVEFWNTIRDDLRDIIKEIHPFQPEEVMKMLKKHPDLAMEVLRELVEHTYRANYPDP